MFSLGSQANDWTFSSSAEIANLREEANKRFISENSKGKFETFCAKHFLSPSEERMLCKHYESMLRDFCRKFKPPMPKNVVGCSFHYYKRFYLNNSVMDYHPKDIVVTCVYLACKVEEFNVSITQFVANVKGDREKATDIILNNELLLMHELNYHLTVHSPYRAVEGFLILMKAKNRDINDPERFRPAIEEFLDKLFFTDACLLYSPSQIALSAVVHGANKFQESLHSFIQDLCSRNEGQHHSEIRNVVKLIWAIVKNLESPPKDQVKQIEKRLGKCRNEENNPNSAAYKRKLQELLDDVDMESSRKYLKLHEKQTKEEEEVLGIGVSDT